MSFDRFDLHPTVLKAVRDAGYVTPTPIQEAAIGPIIEARDVLGCAQTGTGKTAAFALPILDFLLREPRTKGPRCLVLAPTRELVAQIADSFDVYGAGKIRTAVLIGGVAQSRQVEALRAGADVVVAAPGRLLDLMEQRLVNLDDVSILVLDEADRMLDMGFIQPLKRIVRVLPEERQTLLFSATMPKEIRDLAAEFLYDPVNIAVNPVSSVAAAITEEVYHVPQKEKVDLLRKLFLQHKMPRAIVFTRTKHGADRLARKLSKAGVESGVIHGNKSQGARVRALEAFRDGSVRMLIATDVAARGIDVDGVSHVINYDLPNEPESYVHRIGRTGRAGAAGAAIAFCDESERPYLKLIEKLKRAPLKVVEA